MFSFKNELASALFPIFKKDLFNFFAISTPLFNINRFLSSYTKENNFLYFEITSS